MFCKLSVLKIGILQQDLDGKAKPFQVLKLELGSTSVTLVTLFKLEDNTNYCTSNSSNSSYSCFKWHKSVKTGGPSNKLL